MDSPLWTPPDYYRYLFTDNENKDGQEFAEYIPTTPLEHRGSPEYVPATPPSELRSSPEYIQAVWHGNRDVFQIVPIAANVMRKRGRCLTPLPKHVGWRHNAHGGRKAHRFPSAKTWAGKQNPGLLLCLPILPVRACDHRSDRSMLNLLSLYLLDRCITSSHDRPHCALKLGWWMPLKDTGFEPVMCT